MSKASSVRSNPVFNRYGILERELEQYWRKSISGEDNSIPRRLSYQFRSAGIGYQPRRAQETTFLELNSASRAAWAKCALLVREYDKGIILEWHKNLDTLLVFAALFSAVVTALLVESSGIPKVEDSPTSHSIVINAFWVCSLVLALNSVMLAILVKQWLGEYNWNIGTTVLSPEETFALRQMRFEVLQKWRVPAIIDYLPLQLLGALALFYGGLISFLLTMHPVVAGLGIALIGISAIVFVLTTAIPSLWPTAPYQSAQAWLSRRFFHSIRSIFTRGSGVHERPFVNGWVDHGIEVIKSQKDGKFHEEGLLWVQHSLGAWEELLSSTTACALSLPHPIGAKLLIMLLVQHIPPSILDSDDPKDGLEFAEKLGYMLGHQTFFQVYIALHRYLSQFLDSDKPLADPVPSDHLQDGVRVFLVLVRHHWVSTPQAGDGWSLLVALLRSTNCSAMPTQTITLRRVLCNYLEHALPEFEKDREVRFAHQGDKPIDFFLGKGILHLWPVQTFDCETEDELSWILLTSSTLFLLINGDTTNEELGVNTDQMLNCWDCMIQFLEREVKNEEMMEKAVKQWLRVLSPRNSSKLLTTMLCQEQRVSEIHHAKLRELLEALDRAIAATPTLYHLTVTTWTLRLLNAFNVEEILEVFAKSTEGATGDYLTESKDSGSLSSRIRGLPSLGLDKVETIILRDFPISKWDSAAHSHSYERTQAVCLLFHIKLGLDLRSDQAYQAPFKISLDGYGKLLQLLVHDDETISQLERGHQSALETSLAAVLYRIAHLWLINCPGIDEDLQELIFEATVKQCSREQARLRVALPLISVSLLVICSRRGSPFHYRCANPIPVPQGESLQVLQTVAAFFETRHLEVKELPQPLMNQCINVAYQSTAPPWKPTHGLEVPKTLVLLFEVIRDRVFASDSAWDRSSRQRLTTILLNLHSTDV